MPWSNPVGTAQPCLFPYNFLQGFVKLFVASTATYFSNRIAIGAPVRSTRINAHQRASMRINAPATAPPSAQLHSVEAPDASIPARRTMI